MSEQLGGDEHPLFLELRTTRAALVRSQEDVHASTVKLQRYSLDTARTHERAVSLKRENDLLKAELAVLRATPTPTDLSFSSQADIQELTLSLRKLSHKLTLTEEALLAKTEALITAQADLTKAQIGLEVAYELGVELRSREDVEKVRAKKLELKIMQLEEAIRMSDVAIAEYAKLVRDMEARPMSLGSTVQPSKERADDANIMSALSEGRFNSQHLAENFRAQCEELHHEVLGLQGELEVARSQLEAENKGEKAILAECAWMKTELDKLKIDDKTAAKLVARYMQFSQSSTNSLSASLESLRARHDATVATLSSQNHILTSRISALDSQNEHLRTILDDLGGEIMKEKFGRRREIGLRIRMGGREERVVEGLRRWVRKGEEAVGGFECKGVHVDEDGQAAQSDLKGSLIAMSQDARILLESLEDGGADEETALSLSGARAREVMVRDGVDGLLEELRIETEGRILQHVRPLALDKDVYARNGHSNHLTKSDPTIPHSLSLSPEEREKPQTGEQLIGAENVVPVIPSESASADSSVLPFDGHHIVDKELDSSSGSRKDISPSSALTPDLSETQPIDSNQVLDNDDTFREPHSAMNPSSPKTEASTAHHPEEIIKCTFSIDNTEELTSGAPKILCQSVEETSSSAALSSAASLLRPLALPTEPLFGAQPSLEPQPTTSESSFKLSDDSEQQSETPGELLPHPLLAELAEVHKRYDVFQRAFKDCNLALKGLEADLASSSSSVFAHSGQQKTFCSIPMDVLHRAVARLDDFTEDVRVELEIKIGDDVLLAKGYEALLRVPGALHSSSSQSQTAAHSDRTSVEDEIDTDTSLSYPAVQKQIEAFLNETDPAVRKAKETFARKLGDVQHDIAALKRALHDPESFSEGRSPSASMTSPSKMENGLDSATGQGGGWAAWITGSASRPTTPSLEPSHTFGNVITSPRLMNSLGSESHFKAQSPKKTSVFGSLGVLGGKDQPKDPLSLLGLKVPMPSFTTDGYSLSGRVGNGFMSSSPMSATFGGMMSPSYPSTIGSDVSKSRTLSTMYMYGLGALGSRSSGVVGTGGKLMRSVSANTPGSVNDITLPLGRSMGGHDFENLGRETERGKDVGDNDIE